LEYASNNKKSDGIFVDTVKIADAVINYRVMEKWQKMPDDISLKLTLDIGKDFQPEMYIGGQFREDTVSGNVISWGTATKVKILLDNIGLGVACDKNAPAGSQKLPDDIKDRMIGKEFLRLMYRSNRTKQDGNYRIKEWQETGAVGPGNAQKLRNKFAEAVSNSWVKDYNPSSEAPKQPDLDEGISTQSSEDDFPF
tara:strand:- start:28178 stop:28765 length:588 start_codon:yes stop_codon:yes gene_type:complete